MLLFGVLGAASPDISDFCRTVIARRRRRRRLLSRQRRRRRRRRRFATSTAENRLSLSAVLRLTHFWKGVKLEEVCVAQASSFFTTAHHQPSTRGAGAARRPCITLPY